ncbi:hypothetical protein K0H71_15825 [Bacillus sp. IITD106]|nr:hypothetical protein [Bacillus sp. IITD106]
MSIKEKEHIFDGAVFMQLMYMPSYGEDAVEDMWKILKFSLNRKDQLLSDVDTVNLQINGIQKLRKL